MREKLYFDINDIDELRIDPNETYRFFNYTLTGEELLVNIKKISIILEEKKEIDFMGLNPIYRYLFKLISEKKSIAVNDISDKTDYDIAELDKVMISDTIVVDDGALADEYKEVIKTSLEGKKEVIFTQLYKEEQKDNFFGRSR